MGLRHAHAQRTLLASLCHGPEEESQAYTGCSCTQGQSQWSAPAAEYPPSVIRDQRDAINLACTRSEMLTQCGALQVFITDRFARRS